jgi:hypothetical protein
MFCKSLILFFLLSSFAYSADYPAPTYQGELRSFESSFESIAEFKDFYIVPAGEYASAQELSKDRVYHGVYSHKSWITAARAADNDGLVYRPHRAYPTIQLQKTAGGIYRTPCLISLWVYLDVNLVARSKGHINDWFSPVTLSPDPSDKWSSVVTVGIGPDGYAKLIHVPRHNEQTHLYQAGADNDPNGQLRYPQRQWVRLDVYIDFDRAHGQAILWQNGKLVSHARVEGGSGGLAQAHFGLYASAAVASGTVFNDKLRIKEIRDEKEALALVNSPW